jgi:hypothetical protein
MCFLKRRGGHYKVFGFGGPFHFEQKRLSGARTSCSDVERLSSGRGSSQYIVASNVRRRSGMVTPGISGTWTPLQWRTGMTSG